MTELTDLIFAHVAWYSVASITLGLLIPFSISMVYFARRYRPFLQPDEIDCASDALDSMKREARQDLFLSRLNLLSWIVTLLACGLMLGYSVYLGLRDVLQIDPAGVILILLPLFSRWLAAMRTVNFRAARSGREMRAAQAATLRGRGEELSGEVRVDGRLFAIHGEWMRSAHRGNGDLGRTPGAVLDVLYPREIRELYGDSRVGRDVPVWLGHSLDGNKCRFVAFDGMNSYLMGREVGGGVVHKD